MESALTATGRFPGFGRDRDRREGDQLERDEKGARPHETEYGQEYDGAQQRRDGRPRMIRQLDRCGRAAGVGPRGEQLSGSDREDGARRDPSDPKQHEMQC